MALLCFWWFPWAGKSLPWFLCISFHPHFCNWGRSAALIQSLPHDQKLFLLVLPSLTCVLGDLMKLMQIGDVCYPVLRSLWPDLCWDLWSTEVVGGFCPPVPIWSSDWKTGDGLWDGITKLMLYMLYKKIHFCWGRFPLSSKKFCVKVWTWLGLWGETFLFQDWNVIEIWSLGVGNMIAQQSLCHGISRLQLKLKCARQLLKASG